MILYDMMTDAELDHAIALYDLKMRTIAQAGPQMDAAERQYKALMAEKDRRRENLRHLRNTPT